MNLGRLRCEYLKNPIGLDILKPRLSWNIIFDKKDFEQEKRGIEQVSYQILVSTSNDKIKSKNPDVWDSGVVKSNQTINVNYEGSPLQPHTKYFWGVIVKDNQGSEYESLTSENVFWITGFLPPKKWEAPWIGEKSEPKKKIKVYNRAREEEQEIIKSNPSLYLKKTFDIASDANSSKIKRALLYSTALGEYIPYLNGERIGKRYFAPEWTNYHK